MSIPLLDKQANQPKEEKLITNLDKALLLRYLGHPDQYDAVNEVV